MANINIQFKDYSSMVNAQLDEAITAFLHEAGGEIASGASQRTAVVTGQLKGSWSYQVNGHECTVGTPLQRGIWYEYGTGEKALEGNGRKGGWVYRDPLTGKRVFTRGSKPHRPLYKAFEANKGKVEKRAQDIFNQHMGD